MTIDELNLYIDKAVTMKNAGMIVTLGGVGVIAAGIPFILFADSSNEPYISMGAGIICGYVDIASTFIGVPFWAVGGNRKAKAELALQKLFIAPEGSNALGFGIKIRF